jgi:electron transport complex protein RnfG
MTDEVRRDGGGLQGGEEPVGSGPEEGSGAGKADLPDREAALPRDQDVYTPQGGGAGTGSGPIQEVAAVRDGSVARPEESKRLVLDQVAPEETTPQALGAGPEGESHATAGLPEEPQVSSFRLLMTLAVAGAIAGALLVFVFLWSDPIIQAENARVLREAVTEVLKSPDRFESVFILDGELVREVPEGVDTLGLDKVFLGYDEDGVPIGYALAAEGFGFQDIISLIFGYDAGRGEVVGMKVLRHLETPGLGDKIVKDSSFVAGFDGVSTPVEGRKPDRYTGDPGQVETITGVTISSTAVIRIINDRIAELGDLLAAYDPGLGGADTATGGEEGGQ